MPYPGRSPKLPREAACSGNWLGSEESLSSVLEKSAKGIVGVTMDSMVGNELGEEKSQEDSPAEGLNGSLKGSNEESSRSHDEDE